LNHWLNQCSAILWQKHGFNLSVTSGLQQKNRLDSDPTVTEPFPEVSWKANGILQVAQTPFQSRRQNYCMLSSIGTASVDHRQRVHVYKLETLETLTFTDAQWLQLVKTSLTGVQQQSHSFFTSFHAHFAAFFKDLNTCFEAVCSSVLFHHNCTAVHQCT
jgi:hypothetical protein